MTPTELADCYLAETPRIRCHRALTFRLMARAALGTSALRDECQTGLKFRHAAPHPQRVRRSAAVSAHLRWRPGGSAFHTCIRSVYG